MNPEGEPEEGEGEAPQGLIITLAGEPPVEGEVIPGEMIAVPAGTVEMGRPYTDTGDSNEEPVHEAYLDACEIGTYPVTNQEYADILNWALGRGHLTDSEGGGHRVAR